MIYACSYLLASYAKFLWDVDEEEEEEEKKDKMDSSNIPSAPKYLQETPHRAPLAAVN